MIRGILSLLSGVAVGSILAVSVAGVAADPPAPVPPHRHFKFAASGEKVYVGPNFCDVEEAAQGFYGFHHKVHVTDPGLNDILSEPC